VAAGVNPSQHRKDVKQANAIKHRNTVEAVALAWLAVRAPEVTAHTLDRMTSRFKRCVFPYVGNRPLAEVSLLDWLECLKRVERSGTLYTAQRLRSEVVKLYQYALPLGLADRNVAADLAGQLATPKEKHQAALTKPEEVRLLMLGVLGYRGSLFVRAALLLSAYLFQRPGEMRAMQWGDIDFERAQWSYLVTKTNTPHIVPLARQAVAVLRELYPLSGGGIVGRPDLPRYVFPSSRGAIRPMSENTVRLALRTLGYGREEMSAHGFRAMARTLLAEELEINPEWIERQLAHKPSGALKGAYDRTQYLKQRTEMMQVWADYLDKLAGGGAQVLPFVQPVRA
jgi:integrase